MLPIGVIIPTRNSASLLQPHLRSVREWLNKAQEVIVVDSFSKDGTFEQLQAGLQHPRIQFLQHPPGLYQSWNYGISLLEAEYCYISTVGESITPEGLEHLAEVMKQFECDVVVSRPEFIDLEGRPMKSPGWPVEDLVEHLPVREPLVLEGARLLFFALLHYGNAILGSSASNLYRTSCLRKHPFPVDYGTAGDGGWGLQHCARIRYGVTPRRFSTFREHPKSYSRDEYAVQRLTQKFFARICQTFEEERAANPRFAADAEKLGVPRLLELMKARAAFQDELERARESGLWILKPSAWSARRGRSAVDREIGAIRGRLMGV